MHISPWKRFLQGLQQVIVMSGSCGISVQDYTYAIFEGVKDEQTIMVHTITAKMHNYIKIIVQWCNQNCMSMLMRYSA